MSVPMVLLPQEKRRLTQEQYEKEYKEVGYMNNMYCAVWFYYRLNWPCGYVVTVSCNLLLG